MITVTVTDAQPAEGTKGKFSVSVSIRSGENENGKSYEENRTVTVFRYFLADAPFSGRIPEKDDILSAEKYEALLFAEECSNAAVKAVQFLSYGDLTVKKLTEKLKNKGFSREACASAAAFMVKKHYIDEEAQLARLMQLLCERKQYGVRRIKQEVYAKGFSREAVNAVWEDTLDTLDFDAALDKRMEKLGSEAFDTPEKNRRTTASLLRYGFTYDEITNAKRRMDLAEDDLPYEETQDGGYDPDEDSVQ